MRPKATSVLCVQEALMNRGEAEGRVRPQLTKSARHKIRKLKDLAKWAQERDRRRALQRQRCLKLLVYAALSYWCMRPYAASV